MDEQVIRAMARWPDVAAVHGWLRLDARGRWFLIDRGAPGFDPSQEHSGSRITSPPIIDFIGRNYGTDGDGAWYWQNGPQRVYVDLERGPLVFRVFGSGESARLVDQTGHPVEAPSAALTDAHGVLYLATGRGPGSIHDLDMAALDIRADDQ
ncbi:MAG: DUF2946 family protein, partial [Burkholderiaceae bacterium]